MRLPNIVTAISDVLAGVAIAGSLITATFGYGSEVPLGRLLLEQASFRSFYPLLLLVLSTVCLYGGGVTLNDVFDAKTDKKERPERPIPSGVVGKRSAAVFGVVLLLLGIVAAMFKDPDQLLSSSAILAAGIAVAAVVYDKWAKHNAFLGPLNMGICRGLNLLLGMSLLGYALQFYWKIAYVPVIYIAAITMVSRGEVRGGKPGTLYTAGFFYAVVLICLLGVAHRNNNLGMTAPFILLFGALIYPSLRKAIRNPEAPMIGKAVKSGVIALIVMNAAWAAAFHDLYIAIFILILLPVALGLSRLFAVT